MTKLVVDVMPQKSTDCPFAIECENFPCVCDLKRDKSTSIRFGISFGARQKCNCVLDENKDCNMLIAVNDLMRK